MQFHDSQNEQGIVSEARWLVGANATSYPIKDLTRNINRWFDRAVSLIFKAGGRWQWQDSNDTTLASATTDLVSAQQDYTLDVSYLRLDRVEIKNEEGVWQRVSPIDQRDVEGSITEFQATDSTPRFYDMIGNTIYLYPAPNYNQDDSLKLFFQTGASHFATTDTTKQPGFADIFHRYLSLGSAYDYALKNGLQNRNQLREEISLMEESMQDFYAMRQPDEHIRLSAKNSGLRLYK